MTTHAAAADDVCSNGADVADAAIVDAADRVDDDG